MSKRKNDAIIRTLGLRCKACNEALPETDYDGELCVTCLNVVLDMNQDLLSQEEEEDAKKIRDSEQD